MSRTLIRYTIPLDTTSEGTHRLGINSLAIDPSNTGTLYSAGRDGIISAWDLKMSLSRTPHKYDDDRAEFQIDSIYGDTTYKRGIQAHTHWVNEIAMSPDFQTVYSCSSDTTVKSWRPNAFSNDKPESIGSHGDYVKCLVTPSYTKEWIATAGLDRNIILWDTSGKGERLRIDNRSQDGGMKQSIYSLVSGPNMLASGGIEKVVRVWDARSCSRVAKFIGHTDNVRALMCSEDGKTFISASSDTTIKIWDLTAGRCLHTLTLHSDPVWTLMSDHPQLAVFHAADKSGLVTKTDLRPQASSRSDGESLAVCKEATGINSLAQIGDRLFTATSSSSIHRWCDHETAPTDPFADEAGFPLMRVDSSSTNASRGTRTTVQRQTSVRQHARPLRFVMGGGQPSNQSSSNNAAIGHTMNGVDGIRRTSMWSQASVVSLALEDNPILADPNESLKPIRSEPDAVIKGQAGLQAHCMLSDRRRVLTRDSDGFVKLWDITRCKQLSDFGKVDMDDVETKLQSVDAVGSWCTVNTRVGALTVEMDPRNLLDAETYFDAISSGTNLNFDTRNQRFNLGKWMLKTLFKGLVDVERSKTANATPANSGTRRPGRLDLGGLNTSNLRIDTGGEATPRMGMSTPTFGSKNPYASAMSTPGATIGLATPAPTYNPKPNGAGHKTQGSLSSQSSSKDNLTSPTTPGDYFSTPHSSSRDPDATPMATEPVTPGSMPKTPGGSSLMKNMKWLRSTKPAKTPTSDFKKNAPTSSAPSSVAPSPIQTPSEEVTPQNFKEVADLQRKKFAEDRNNSHGSKYNAASWIHDMEPMPELTIPSSVGISVALFSPGEGEAKDIYRGTVGSLGNDFETVAPLLPAWLGQILLLNEVPAQMQNIEGNKHYFSFVPHSKSSLPDPFNTIPSNLMRLGAARSLRIRKALTYISQRLPVDLVQRVGQGEKEEMWLEIIINGTTVDPDWTLMMARRHLWKQGGDMKLEYKLKTE